MKKNDFIAELAKRLEGLPESDINNSLDYYREMIEDRIEEGLDEEKAVGEIGTPAEIATAIFKATPLVKVLKARVKPKRSLSVFEIVLLVLGSPVWLSLLIAAAAVLFSVYVVIWSLAISLWAVEVSLAAAGVAGILCLPVFAFQGNTMTGIVYLFAGIFSLGLSIFMFYACLHLTKLLLVASKKIFLSIKFSFVRKETFK